MSDQLVLAGAPLVALGGLMAVLSIIDLAGREAGDVAGGRKLPWYLVALAVPFGPLAYLWFGRRVRRRG